MMYNKNRTDKGNARTVHQMNDILKENTSLTDMLHEEKKKFEHQNEIIEENIRAERAQRLMERLVWVREASVEDCRERWERERDEMALWSPLCPLDVIEDALFSDIPEVRDAARANRNCPEHLREIADVAS